MTNPVRALHSCGSSFHTDVTSQFIPDHYLTLEDIQYCEEKTDEEKALKATVLTEGKQSQDLIEEFQIKEFWKASIINPSILYKVGSGVYGMVFKVGYEKGDFGALKCSRADLGDYVTKEAELIKSIANAHIPHIVTYQNSYDDGFFKRSIILLDYHALNLRNLIDILNKNHRHLPLDGIRGVALATFTGLFHLSDVLKLVHLDIKPENLLVDTTQGKLSVKIADFGLAQNFTDHPHIKPLQKQSLQYRSPHVLTGKAKDNDTFSVGAVIAEVVVRKMLFGLDVQALSNEGRVIPDAELMRRYLNLVFSLVGAPSLDFINKIPYSTLEDVYESKPLSYSLTEYVTIKELVWTARKDLNESEDELLQLSQFIKSTLEYENPKSLKEYLEDPFLVTRVEKEESVESLTSDEVLSTCLDPKKRKRSDSSNSPKVE